MGIKHSDEILFSALWETIDDRKTSESKDENVVPKKKQKFSNEILTFTWENHHRRLQFHASQKHKTSSNLVNLLVC